MAKKKDKVIVFTSSNKDMTKEQSLELLLKAFQIQLDKELGNQYDNASTNYEKRV